MKSTRAGVSLATACGLALCVIGTNRLDADTFVTFQVDMSEQARHGRFNLLTQSVIAVAYEWHGGNRVPSWSLQLTNEPAAATPCLYRGTGLITNDAPGAILCYYFFVPSPERGWGDAELSTRSARLPDAEGASLVLPVVYYDDEAPVGKTNTIALTFQVDMTAQVGLGGFNPASDWASVGARCEPGSVTYGHSLTNNPHAPNPHLYTTTVACTNFVPGGVVNYRFDYYSHSAGRYVGELPLSTCGNERTATLPATPETSLVLPVVHFDDLPAGVPWVTNDVTFQVDLSAQRPALLADWRPDEWPLFVRSRVSIQGGDVQLTNSNSAINTNIYCGTLRMISLPGARFEYRFRYWTMLPSWECEEQSVKRSFSLLDTNGSVILPVVFFDNLEPADVLPRSTEVRFSVDMTGAVTTDGHPFHPTLDRVFVNGDFVRWHLNGEYAGAATHDWGPWDPVVWAPVYLSNYYLTNVPGTQVYTGAVTLEPSDRLALAYRYSINGQDNEPPGGQNRVRYVRAAGEYTLPLDRFGAPVQEPSFGNFKATVSDPQHVLISWLGRPGVRLQSCAHLATGPWQDHPETDGLSATNWPLAEGGSFFRLVKP